MEGTLLKTTLESFHASHIPYIDLFAWWCWLVYLIKLGLNFLSVRACLLEPIPGRSLCSQSPCCADKLGGNFGRNFQKGLAWSNKLMMKLEVSWLHCRRPDFSLIFAVLWFALASCTCVNLRTSSKLPFPVIMTMFDTVFYHNSQIPYSMSNYLLLLTVVRTHIMYVRCAVQCRLGFQTLVLYGCTVKQKKSFFWLITGLLLLYQVNSFINTK